jgi:hypothetical protein
VIAVFLLYRSMTGHLRRLPEKFPQPDDTADGTANAGEATPPQAPGEQATGSPTGPEGDRTGSS